MELQWIDDDHNANFPRGSIARNIGQISLTELPKIETFEHHTTFQDCLKIFSKEEDLGHDACWKCTKCNRIRVAKKSAHLVRTPNLLAVQFVRIKHFGNTTTKAEDRIEFPIEGFDISPWVMNNQEGPQVYDLYAVVNHYGNTSSGHYAAHIREWNDHRGKLLYFYSFLNSLV